MHKLSQALFCFGMLLVGCSHLEQRRELVTGISPLGKDIFSSVESSQFESGNFTSSNGTFLPYRLLRPSHIKAGKKYPLVLQLHGSDGIGTDNTAQLDRLAKSWAMPDTREQYQAYILIPQLPTRSANYGPAAPDQKSEPSPALSAALELARNISAKNQVDHSRIYAVGFSMGGSATWLAPTLDQSLFAAIVPISGIAPDDSYSRIFKNLPVLILHGNSDEENPITSDRRFFAAIQGTGGHHVQFREYDGLAHQPPSDIYPGTWWRSWLFKQSRQ